MEHGIAMWFFIGIIVMFSIIDFGDTYGMPVQGVGVLCYMAGAVFIMIDTITTVKKSAKRRR